MHFFGRFGKFKETKIEIRWFFQRGTKGYCDKDIWELNTWFATTFSRMLTELGEKTVSYPPGFGISDHGKSGDNGLNPQFIPEDKGEEEFLAWKAAIKKAAEQFAATGGYTFEIPSEEEKRNRDEAFEFVRYKIPASFRPSSVNHIGMRSFLVSSRMIR